MNPLQDPRTVVWLGLLLLGTLIRVKGAALDPAFDARLDGGLHQVAVQNDGKIIVAGWFTAINGEPRPGIARLESNGGLDPSFDPALPASAAISSFAIAPDAIYVSGNLGLGASHLVKLNFDGSIARTFSPSEGPNAAAARMLVDAQERLLIAGAFTECANEPRPYLARLNVDGTLDATFAPPIAQSRAMEAGVTALHVDAAGNITVGGIFRVGEGDAKLVRLNADGALDSAFAAPQGELLYAHALAAGTGQGQLYAAGQAQGAAYCALLNADRSADAGFALPELPYGRIDAIARDAAGNVIIGGGFNSVGAVATRNLARLDQAGQPDPSFQFEFNNMVLSLASEANGGLLVAGVFTAVDGQPRVGLARMQPQPAPAFLRVACNKDGQFCAILQASIGARYTIETSENLKDWTELDTVTAESTEIEISAAQSAPGRFFRARRLN